MARADAWSPEDLIWHFRTVTDPRVVNRSKHGLTDILVIAVCAILSGARGWLEIEEFAEARAVWLGRYLPLSGGIPSHDTIARVFCLIDSEEFEATFTAWVSSRLETRAKRICLDGKSVAGTERAFNEPGKKALHLVSAYAQDHALVLAQAEAFSTGSGETEGALTCLERLDKNLKGTLISVDAGLANHRIAAKIREKKGDYLFPIKRNQRHSLSEIEEAFKSNARLKKANTPSTPAHGRIEKRSATIQTADNLSDKFHEQWPDVQTLIRIERDRKWKDTRFVRQESDERGKNYYVRNRGSEWRSAREVAYYVSSRDLTPMDALEAVREHWSIENNLHWVLDVAMSEDQWRGREKIAARNLSQVRKFALNLIRKLPDRGSVRVKMQRAAWNLDYLEKIVFET